MKNVLLSRLISFACFFFLFSDFSTSCSVHPSLNPACDSAISVVAMAGAAIAINDAAATDTIRSVKERVHAANRELPVRRQRLVYRPGPCGLEALADDETLGGAGLARDGTAELDVLLVELTDAEMAALGKEV